MNSHCDSLMLQDYAQLAKDAVPFLPFHTVPKESSRSAHFPGFTKVKNVYITGHSDGTISVWDMTCSFPILVLFLKEQVRVLGLFCVFRKGRSYEKLHLLCVFLADRSRCIFTRKCGIDSFTL